MRRLVVIGGDGTLLDVVNEIHGREMEIGLVPVGNGNDIASATGIPKDFESAVDLLARWDPRPIDLVRVRFADGSERLYVGVGGAGLDAEAARIASGSRYRLPGIYSYLVGALIALARQKPFTVSLDFDEGNYRGSAVLVAFANAPAYGGGIRIAPEALLDDGWLDIALLETLDWGQAIRALPSLFHSGELRGIECRRWRTQRARLETSPSVAFHGDGEILGATPLEIEVLPGALRLVAPKVSIR